MRLSALLLSLIAATVPAFGQNPDKTEFDAASLKPSGSQSVRMERTDPAVYSFGKATLRDLLFKAWNLTDYDKQISGPAWMREDSFDLIARFPGGTTKDDFRTMLQNLVIERFGLVVHKEAHDLPVYALVIGKGGSKLREPGSPPAQPAPKGDDCFPQLRPGRPDIGVGNAAGGRRCLAAQDEPIAMLLRMLRPNLDRPLVDRTGLAGRYDFAFEFGPQLPDQSATPGPPDIVTAIQQLGLRLESSKAPYEILIVDHAERSPLPN